MRSEVIEYQNEPYLFDVYCLQEPSEAFRKVIFKPHSECPRSFTLVNGQEVVFDLDKNTREIRHVSPFLPAQPGLYKVFEKLATRPLPTLD